jgi:hypothetical protein
MMNPNLNLRGLTAHENRVHVAYVLTIKEIRDRKIRIIKARRFTCSHCSTSSKLSRWEFTQSHTYVPPSGCQEGDYWIPNKTEVCHLRCPECLQQNYLYNHPHKIELLSLFDTNHILKREVFEKIWEKHGNNLKQIYPETKQQNLLT